MAVKETAKTTEAPSKAKEECAFSAYIGPNRLGAFNRATLFPCSVKDALKLPEVVQAIERYPEIKKEIVPGDELYKYN